MRELKIPKQIITDDFTTREKYIWDHWKDGFKQMFAYKYGDIQELVSREDNSKPVSEKDKQFFAEVLYPPLDHFDWGWYSPLSLKTYGRSETNEEYYYDNIIKEWLSSFEANDKNILTIHGRRGVGKTTLLRHFFNNYISNYCPGLGENLFCLRLSVPLIALSLARMEEDIDHKIYNYLINTFTKGNYNLHAPDVLIKMCLSEYPKENKYNDLQYFKENPPPLSTPAQLKWLREVGLAREGKTIANNVVSPWADFNRLSIQYLTDNDIKIIIILDNIDQLPPQQQIHAWNIIRTKLDWIKSRINIAYVISFRSYLLDNAYSLGGIEAYSDKMKLLQITSPKLYDVLIKRKTNYFDPVHKNQKTNLKYGTYGITVNDPSLFIERFLSIFIETDIYVSIARLSNFNLRVALNIAKYIFQYPYYNKSTVEEAAKIVIAARNKRASTFLSFSRIVDTIVRHSNKLCNIDNPIFDNLFCVCRSSHFSNTLAKIYIIKLLQSDTSVEKLKSMLINLKHDPYIIDISIKDFLRYSIITSPQGNDIENHSIERLSLSNSSYGDIYINHLFYNLYYLQAMAYRTYFDKEIISTFDNPKKLDEEVTLLTKRLLAALALVEQFLKDEREQIEKIKGEDILTQKIFIDYRLANLGKNLYRNVFDQILRLKSIKPKISWHKVDDRLNHIYNKYMLKSA